MAMVPCVAKTTPLLRTSGASKAIYPPNSADRCPSLITLPVAPLRLNVVLPAIKSEGAMLCVVATKPPTFTLAVGLKYTPPGLTINT